MKFLFVLGTLVFVSVGFGKSNVDLIGPTQSETASIIKSTSNSRTTAADALAKNCAMVGLFVGQENVRIGLAVARNRINKNNEADASEKRIKEYNTARGYLIGCGLSEKDVGPAL